MVHAPLRGISLKILFRLCLRVQTKETETWHSVVVDLGALALVGAVVVSLGVVAVALAVCGSALECK